MIKAGIVLPLRLQNIPNYRYLHPFLRESQYVRQGEQVYGVPVVFGQYGLAYNQDVVEKAPDSWAHFWQPEFQLRYAISADYHEANIYITALSLGYRGQQLFDYDLLRADARFLPQLSRLAQGAASMWKGVDRASDLHSLAIATAWGFSFKELQKSGEFWQFAQPQEGVTGWVDNWLIGYSVLHDPMKRRIAEAWIDFTLSTQMQLYYVRHLGQFAVVDNILPMLTAAEAKHQEMAQRQMAQGQLLLWQILNSRQQNGFRSMWEQAKTEATPEVSAR